MKTVIPVRAGILLSRCACIDLADKQDVFSSPKLMLCSNHEPTDMWPVLCSSAEAMPCPVS